jgi:hypothetical protein
MKRFLRIMLLICALAYLASWFVVLFGLKSVTLLNPQFLTDNLVGISYTAGTGISIMMAMVYQCLYIVVILPITIVTHVKGFWKTNDEPAETDKSHHNSRKIYDDLDITQQYPFL